MTFVSRIVMIQALLVECHWLYRMSTEFFDFEFQSRTSHQGSDFGAQPTGRLLRLVGRIPQNVADFFLHAAAIALGTALQPSFDRLLQVANNHLGQRDPPM